MPTTSVLCCFLWACFYVYLLCNHNQLLPSCCLLFLDVIRNANYIIDMGPGGGKSGGEIVAAGTPADIKSNPDSVTGKFIE